MAETPAQYTQRVLAHVGGQDPWAVLASTPDRLRTLIEAAAPEDLRRAPGPGRWSIGHIVAHLADCEVVAGWRLRSLLATNGVALQPFDQDRWAQVFRYDEVPAEESLQVYSINRRANLALLRRVDPALLANHGMHAERGRESGTHLVQFYAGHDLNHLRQVEQILRST